LLLLVSVSVISLTLIETTTVFVSLRDLVVYLWISHTWLMNLTMVDVSLLSVHNRWPHSVYQDVNKIILNSCNKCRIRSCYQTFKNASALRRFYQTFKLSLRYVYYINNNTNNTNIISITRGLLKLMSRLELTSCHLIEPNREVREKCIKE
jgi:hypothetical protein